jgi:predicted TIM-barrel fold metal-dependent hydrolase
MAEPGGLASLVDCDVHAVVADVAVLEPHLDDHWREVLATTQFTGPTDQAHPPNLATSLGDYDAVDGDAPGTTLTTLRAHVLEPLRAEIAILACDYAVDSIRNPDAAAALAAAANDWLIAEWLERDPRLRAAIVVPTGQPAMAAAEIARVAEHPGFVAVHLPVRAAMPYGNRQWWPLLDAIVAHDLVAHLHFGGAPGLPPTASGWPTSWLEEHVDMASAFQSQLTSLVAEGTFDRYPALRLALLEAGFAWLPAFLWRFDKSWRGLRREIPWTKRPPSAYVREHVRVGLQPVDGPTDPAQLLAVIDQLGSDELLMFATDYPHRHVPDGLSAVPAELPDGLADRILSANARDLYRLS